VTDWLDANRHAVAEAYPNFREVSHPGFAGAVFGWQGVIQPFLDVVDMAWILDDLENGASVKVCAGGLRHDSGCCRNHQVPVYFHRVTHTWMGYKVLVVAYRPERHPRAYCLSPAITKLGFPLHPHIGPGDSACGYLPSDGILPWDESTIVSLLDFTAIWLAKHIVWMDTGADEKAKWLGIAGGHSIRQLFSSVDPNSPCPCGYGKRYKECCRPNHERNLRASDRQMELIRAVIRQSKETS